MSTPVPADFTSALSRLIQEHDVPWTDVRTVVEGLRPHPEPGATSEDDTTESASAFRRAIAAQWQDLLERLPVIALGLDRNGNVQFANQYFHSLTGFEPEDVVGHHWFERFVPADVRMDVREAFAAILEKEFHATYENPLVDAAGRERLIRWFNVRLLSEEGRIAGTFSLGQEVMAPTGAGMALAGSRPTAETETVVACAWCNRIQNEDEKWTSAAKFITDALGREVTHGLCPSCFRYVSADTVSSGPGPAPGTM